MMELLYRFQPGELIGLTAVIGGMTCAIVAIAMGIGHATRKAELDAGLKKSMLERGMSAQEIRMVMEAGAGESIDHAKQPAYQEI